jgi:hypothetical protein
MISNRELLDAAQDCLDEMVSDANVRTKLIQLRQLTNLPSTLQRQYIREFVAICADTHDMFNEVNARLGNNVSEGEAKMLMQAIIDKVIDWIPEDDVISAYERAMGVL